MDLTALPQASWLAFGDGTRRGEGEESGREKEEKGRTGKGNGRKGTGERKGEKGVMGREKFCAVVIFP